ncbi:hypothetical protein V1517DRAFT_267479, partial [Lipomyces orientalis]
MEFLNSASTILSSIPAIIKQQVMSPDAPDVTDRLRGCTIGTSGTSATTMVKFDGKNYRKWAMYMEALFVQKSLWDVVSGSGFYDVTNVTDAAIVIKKNSFAYLDFVLTLGDYEPGLLETKDVQHIWRSMEERYRLSSLSRQLELVNKLFTWKCKKTDNPDKWVQEWCDTLKEFLNLQ